MSDKSTLNNNTENYKEDASRAIKISFMSFNKNKKCSVFQVFLDYFSVERMYGLFHARIHFNFFHL